MLFWICQKVSEYEQEMPQSHTTDQPIDREEEAKNNDRELTFRKQ